MIITFSRSCGGTGLEEDTLLMDLLREFFRHEIFKVREKKLKVFNNFVNTGAVRNIKLIVIYYPINNCTF